MVEEDGYYLLHLLMSKRPVAIDSVAGGFCTDISIVVLNGNVSLWGVKTIS